MGAVVSIITATFNRAHLLPRTWASLECQTEGRFQWIVVDDGSTDHTDQFFSHLQDDRIQYIHQDHQGCNVARARGEREITSDLVLFLDSDDELATPETLSLMVRTLQEAPEEIGAAAFAVSTPKGGGGHSQFAEKRMILGYEDLICGCKTQGEALRIFRRKALESAPFWPECNGLEGLRWYEIAKSYPFLYVHQPALIYHMNHGQNLTSARFTIERSAGLAKGYRELLRRYSADWLSHCPKVYGRHLFHAAMYDALSGDKALCRQHAIAAVRHGMSPVPVLTLLLSLLLPTPLRHRIFIWRSGLKGRC